MPKGYDVSFINPILESVSNVLTTMAHVEATPGKPYVNTDRTAIGDITGLIGITGTLTGVISVTFDTSTILRIVNNMLSEHYTSIDNNIADAVGELTNMITGQARLHLSKEGMKLQASTPSVVIGKGHVLSHISPSPILAIPFATPDGPLAVEFSMEIAQPQTPAKTTLWRKGTPPPDVE